MEELGEGVDVEEFSLAVVVVLLVVLLLVLLVPPPLVKWTRLWFPATESAWTTSSPSKTS